VIGGEMQLTFANLVAVLPHVQSGRLRALGLTSAKRSAAAPSLPTIAEGGLSGYDFTSWFGMLVPAGTPKEAIRRISDGIIKALNTPDLSERLTGNGADIIAAGPREFSAYLQSETAKWSKVIGQAGIKPE
jgi:tripartite-type tricarboxylate transporter receptor subunit TctC